MSNFPFGFGMKYVPGSDLYEFVPILERLSLSSNDIADGSASGVVVGTIQNFKNIANVTITDDAGGRFTISGSNIVTGLVATDHATNASHTIELTETDGAFPNSPRPSPIDINVIPDAVTLGTLGLDATTFTIGTPSNGAITGATPGSTITPSNTPTGFSINSAARTWSYNGSGSATTGTLTLTEALAGATNTPNPNDIGFTVADAAAISAFTSLGDSLMPGRDNLDSGRDGNDPAVANAIQYVNHNSQVDYQQLRSSVSPMWHSDDGVARISPMEHMLSTFNGLAGNDVAIVPCGNGGSSLDADGTNQDWNPNTPGTDLTDARDAHNAAMALFAGQGTTTCDGIAVCLSSNDMGKGTYDSPTYQQLWLDFIDYIRANFNGVTATTPIVISGPVANSSVADTAREDLEIAVAQRLHVFVMHDPIPTASGDNLHRTKAENRTSGAAMGTLFHQAKTGTVPIPTITTNATQGSIEGEATAVNLHHTGLDADSPNGIIEITGGTDAALFQIGGTFHAPTLEKVDPDLVPGTYDVEVSVRNNAGQFGTAVSFVYTVSAAPSIGPIVTTLREHLEIGTSGFGGQTLASRTIRAGLNVFLWRMVGGNKDST